MAIEPNSSFPQSFSGLDPLQKLNFVWGHRYYHYLPTAFDDSLDFYEQITNFIEYLNQTKRLTDSLVDQWEQIKAWIINDGLTDAVKAKLDEWLKSGVIAQVFGQTITNQIYDAIRAVASGSPTGVYSNADALKTAYPNGDTHIYITADDGNWNYWSDGAWHKGGLYQAPKLDKDSVTGDNVKDNSLSSDDIGSLNYDRVYPTVANNMLAEMWYPDVANGFLTKGGNNIVLTKSKEGDNGLLIPVDTSNLPYPSGVRPWKVSVKFALSNETFTGATELYIADDSKNVKFPMLGSSTEKSGTISGIITPDVVGSWNLSKHFYVLVAVHGGTGNLNVTETTFNISDDTSVMERLDTVPALSAITGSGSAIMPQYATDNYLALQQATMYGDSNDKVTLEPDKYGFSLQKNGSGEFSGVRVPIIWHEAITPTNPVIVNFDFNVTGATGFDSVQLWLSDEHDALKPVKITQSTATSGHVKYLIEKALADAWDLNNEKYWKVCVMLFAKTGTIEVTNLIANYSGNTMTPVEKEKQETLVLNSHIASVTGNANALNSYMDYGTTQLRIVDQPNDNLSIISPYHFILQKRAGGADQGVMTQVVHPQDITLENTDNARVKYKITNATNFSKIELYLWGDGKQVHNFPVASSTELEGELTKQIAMDLVTSWDLNTGHYWLELRVTADTADVEVTNWVVNASMTSDQSTDLAQKTIKSDHILSGSQSGLSPYWNDKPSVWGEASDSNSVLVDSDVNNNYVNFKALPTAETVSPNKGVVIWLSKRVLKDFPNFFYLNVTAKISSGNLDAHFVDNNGNYKGSFNFTVAKQSFWRETSILIDTKQIVSTIGDVPRVGISFNFQTRSLVQGGLKDFSITQQPVYRTAGGSIANSIQAGNGGGRTYLGKLDPSANVSSTHTGLTYVGFDAQLPARQKVAMIKCYLTSAQKINLVSASIDQNTLMVNKKVLYTFDGKVGWSSIDLRYENCILEANEHLFFEVNGNLTQYDALDADTPDYVVVDNTHAINQGNYSGNGVYNDGKIYPFYAELVELPASNEADFTDINTKITAIQSNYNPIIKRDDGALQRLKLDKNNLIYWEKVIPDKIAIFGNSLTLASGNIGMVASDQYHDWYYLFTSRAKSYNPDMVPSARLGLGEWEQATDTASRQTVFDTKVKPNISADTGMVIYQLIDNINSDERLATFEHDAEQLIANTKAIAPKAMILWIAGWFVDDNKMALVKQACENQGATLVDITAYKDNPANKSELGATRTGTGGDVWQITNPGEAIHPGDTGMQLIANKIFETLGL